MVHYNLYYHLTPVFPLFIVDLLPLLLLYKFLTTTLFLFQTLLCLQSRKWIQAVYQSAPHFCNKCLRGASQEGRRIISTPNFWSFICQDWATPLSGVFGGLQPAEGNGREDGLASQEAEIQGTHFSFTQYVVCPYDAIVIQPQVLAPSNLIQPNQCPWAVQTHAEINNIVGSSLYPNPLTTNSNASTINIVV